MKWRVAAGVAVVVLAACGLLLLPRPKPAESVRSAVKPRHEPVSMLPSTGSGLEEDLKAIAAGRAEAASRLRNADPYELERAVLERERHLAARSEILRTLEARGDRASRLFVLDVLKDATEEISVRLAALALVVRRRDDEGCDALIELWARDQSWPERAGYHLVWGMGETGRPAALPVITECAGPAQGVEIRGHGVQALGAHVSDPAVRERLRKIALTDGVPLVRVNALGALAKSKEPDVDEFLKGLAGKDDEVGRAAKGFLDQRRP